jgi:sortase A
MWFTRTLGLVGRALMSAGVILLLFVAFQLWGTGISTAQSQDRLGQEFEAKLQDVQAAAAAAASTTTTTTTAATVDDSADTTTTTAPGLAELGADPAVQAELANLPPPTEGDPIGKITIPAIGSDFWYVEGVSLDVLRFGPGHFPSTPFPGQPGNAALAGHRTTFKAPFNRIDELNPGDPITIDTLQGRFTYEVLPQPNPNGGPDIGHFIIYPDETRILDQTEGENTLTLMACHPKYDLKQRIVVTAKLIDNPAPPTPRNVEASPTGDAAAVADLGTASLSGTTDTGARTTALLWSLAAAVVWFLTWLVTRRWRRWQWPIWAVGFVVFLVPLYFAFDHVNKLLPAGY